MKTKRRYFQHDYTPRQDPKIMALLEDYGVEGYGRYWILLEYFAADNGYKFEDSPLNWKAIAFQMQTKTEEVKKFLNDCVEKFLLLEKEDNYYFSPSFHRRMQHIAEVSEKRAHAGSQSHKNDDD
jgi:hypothetical protein